MRTPTISKRSQSRHGPPSRRDSRAKYGLALRRRWRDARATTPPPLLANAPDAPSPRPMTTNAASSTSPSPTPARYGSAYGRGLASARRMSRLALRRRVLDGIRLGRRGATSPGTSRRTAAPDGRASARRTAWPSPAGRCGSSRRPCRPAATPAFANSAASSVGDFRWSVVVGDLGEGNALRAGDVSGRCRAIASTLWTPS